MPVPFSKRILKWYEIYMGNVGFHKLIIPNFVALHDILCDIF